MIFSSYEQITKKLKHTKTTILNFTKRRNNMGCFRNLLLYKKKYDDIIYGRLTIFDPRRSAVFNKARHRLTRDWMIRPSSHLHFSELDNPVSHKIVPQIINPISRLLIFFVGSMDGIKLKYAQADFFRENNFVKIGFFKGKRTIASIHHFGTFTPFYNFIALLPFFESKLHSANATYL